MTKNIIDCVTEYKTLDSESNHSDHLGLLLSLNTNVGPEISKLIQSGYLYNKTKNDDSENKTDGSKRLRWDESNI